MATMPRRVHPHEVEYERRVIAERIVAEDRAEKPKIPPTKPLKTTCSCTLSLSAFPTRRAFDEHRQICEAGS